MTEHGEPFAYLLTVLTTMPDECTTWPYKHVRGYGQLRWPFGKRQPLVHQVVCEWYHGPRPDGMLVRHLCGNGARGCFTPSHLCWGTPAEDRADMIRHGTTMRGERGTKAKLTEIQVADIRARYLRTPKWHSNNGPGPSQTDLAREYGVTQSTISDIISGKHWQQR